jgi:polysaccharide export outer membrane protein
VIGVLAPLCPIGHSGVEKQAARLAFVFRDVQNAIAADTVPEQFRSGDMRIDFSISGTSKVLTVLFSVFAMAGCGALPNSGPNTDAIVSPPAQTADGTVVAPPYDLVPISPSVVQALELYRVSGFGGTFGGSAGPSGNLLGGGDVVQVAIYEASTGGLFGSGDLALGVGVKNTVLPPQQIDRNGYISVPFAGRVRAAGRTPIQVGEAVRAALAAKAIDPQVVVSLTQNAANTVTVAGEVGQGGRYPIAMKGDRVLDAIASAGGPKAAAHEIYVRLTRGSRTGVVRLSTLVARPEENVALRSGDEIFLYRKPDTFTVLGASGHNSTFQFDQIRVSLAEALGKAGGLNDSRADAGGVFLFRYEDARVYNALRLAAPVGRNRGGAVPVVYHVNLKDPQSLLLAQRVEMRDKDVLYVSNSPSTEVLKLFQLVGASVGIASSGAGIAAVTTR